MTRGAPARVLVVEDRASVRQVLEAILEPAWRVAGCADGAAALALLAGERYDVLLTDVRMPGMSGLELLREARRRAPQTRVVVMTAYANGPDALAALREGAFDYLAKPVDADDLSLAVARAADAEPDPDVAARTAAVLAPRDDESPGTGLRRAEAAREAASRRWLARLVAACDGDLGRAAGRAGLTPEGLDRLLVRYGAEGDETP